MIIPLSLSHYLRKVLISCLSDVFSRGKGHQLPCSEVLESMGIGRFYFTKEPVADLAALPHLLQTTDLDQMVEDAVGLVLGDGVGVEVADELAA